MRRGVQPECSDLAADPLPAAKKKLGLTENDAYLDNAIKDVLEEMKDGKSNPRLAVYYKLADKFGKLGVFK